MQKKSKRKSCKAWVTVKAKLRTFILLASPQRKRIGCDQSLNQLWSLGLGYMAEQVGTQKNKSPLSGSATNASVPCSDCSVTLIQKDGDSELNSLRSGFCLSSPRHIPRPCTSWLSSFSTVKASHKVGRKWRRTVYPFSNQGPQITTARWGHAYGLEEDAILLCLVTASPGMEFIMNYRRLWKTSIITL